MTDIPAKTRFPICLLAWLALAPAALAADFPPRVQALLDAARSANPPRYQFAVDRGAQIGATEDGRSFYLLWYPPGTDPDRRTLIVSTHGSGSWAFDEFYLWYEAALARRHGILALQWYFPGAPSPADYYSPSEVYDALEPVLRRQGIRPGYALQHGFSRGGANGYYVALLDRTDGGRYFGFCIANAGGASVDYPYYQQVVGGTYGALPFAGTRWATYCGGTDPNPDRDGCPAMRRTAEYLRRYGGSVELTIEDPARGHGGFHQTPAYLDLALSAFDTVLLDISRSWTAEADSLFRIPGASIPNAGWMKSEVWLTVSGSGGMRLYRSADGNNAATGETIPGLSEALSGTGFTATETVPRLEADGTRSLYVLGLGAPGANRAEVFRLRENAAGRFQRDPESAVFSGIGGWVGVPDLYPSPEGGWRLIYVALGAARQNARVALSRDAGRSFAGEYDNPFNDLNVENPNASSTSVDPAVLRTAQGGTLAAAMRLKKLYLFSSSDGRHFLPLNRQAGQDAPLDAAQLFPGGTGFFDPTLVQLPDGRIWMYATLEQGSQPQSVVRVALRPPGATRSLFLPRLAENREESTGLSLVNAGAIPARVSLTAWRDDGRTAAVSAPDLNPLSFTLPPGAQLARLAAELFGPGLGPFQGWLEVGTEEAALSGLFMNFDPAVNMLDGLPIVEAAWTRCLLPVRENGELSLLHPGRTRTAEVRFRFLTRSGEDSLPAVDRSILPRSRAAIPVRELAGPASDPDLYYLLISSSEPLIGLEKYGATGSHASLLPCLDAAAGSARLIAPQFVFSEAYRSALHLYNPDARAASVEIRWIGDDGQAIGEAVRRDMPPLGSLSLTDPAAFQVGLTPGGRQGYLSVTAGPDGRLTGFVEFGDPAGAVCRTAFPLASQGKTSALFGQIAENDAYFTGLAVVNPDAAAASAEISVFDEKGAAAGSAAIGIPPRGRLAGVLSRLVSAASPMTRGYFRIRSDRPLISYALFGTRSGSALAAIPSP